MQIHQRETTHEICCLAAEFLFLSQKWGKKTEIDANTEPVQRILIS